jgi:hypothetical protein
VNDRRSSSDLGSSAEATLAAFPFPERDWERDARAIEARISSSLRGSTDASLLAAPLPSEPDEPSTVSATATPLTNSGVRTQSLAELARRSVEKKQANDRQMARESLALAALAAQQRPKSPSSEALTVPTSDSGGGATNVSASGAVAPGRAQASAAAARATPFPKIALAFPALALAAAAVLWFRHPESTAPVSAELAPTTPSTATPSAAAASANSLAQNHPTAPEEVPRGIDPSTLPAQDAPAPDSAASKVAAVGAAAPAKATASKPGSMTARAAAEANGDPGLPPDPALRPADSRSGGLPAKPTTGAVQAALGSVMSGARHCVAGDDAPSRAVVVFGSDGRVQQVTVSGSAAGKSSASCIEAQLSRARVQPFGAASFSVNATVRPE